MKYVLVLFVLILAENSFSVSLEKMKITRAADLETSASGYIYSQATGHPTSYVQFSSNSHPALPLVQYYVADHTPDNYAPLVVQPVEELDHENIDEGVEDDKQEYSAGEQENNKEFEKSGGEEYETEEKSAHGEKGDKGYKNKHEFSEGEKGQHSTKHDEGYYKENGGKKSGQHDSAGHYNKHYEEGKGSKGEESGESQYHKKGQKTTGFHNVYHKDEYKKDHTFYDEADQKGFYKKHGNHQTHHSAEDGGHVKGGKSEADYQSNQHGKKGSYDKGHYDKEDKGFNGQHGHEAHHDAHEEFSKEAGKQGGAEHGYTTSGKKY